MQDQYLYLENEVRSSTPQRLRVLLIEGGVRFARQAKYHLESGNRGLADSAAGRVRSILSELHDSVEGDTELAVQMRLLYGIALTQFLASETSDLAKACDDLLPVLAEELATWQQVCEIHPQLPQEVIQARASQAQDLTSRDAEQILNQQGSSAPHDAANHNGQFEERNQRTSSPRFCLDA